MYLVLHTFSESTDETWPNSGNILRVELVEFANRFYVDYERKMRERREEVNDDSMSSSPSKWKNELRWDRFRGVCRFGGDE